MNTVVIQDLANSIIAKIAESAISEMKKNRDVLLSGEDSGLRNLWEEYVAQVRGGESFHYDEYQEAVENYCSSEVNKISKLEKLIVTLGADQTSQEFEEWLEESEKAIHYENILPNNAIIISEVCQQIERIAEEYTSRNIERYLNNEEEEE